MKKKEQGAFFEYEEDRNRNLMEVFRDLCARHPSKPLIEIYGMLVEQPSERFWVSEERATIVITSMMKGHSIGSMMRTKREMFQEIYDRTMEEMRRCPDDSVYDCVFRVVNSPAPKFYLTPGSVKVIIHKIKHEWYEERKRKYRHLFM